MWTYRLQPVRLPTPPLHPREWTITLPMPDGVEIGDHDAHDRMAADLAPTGYMVAGTIPISRRDAPRDAAALTDPIWWRIRITYVPASWRREVRAPYAVYAAAQVVGISTGLDDVMAADFRGLQFFTPSGHPVRRECGRWTDGLPEEIQRALGTIEYVGQRRGLGYMRGRPNTGLAQIVAMQDATGDDALYAQAQAVVRTWIASAHPEIMEG